MATDAERLAVAEEIVARFPPMRIQFKDFFVQHGGVRWYAYRGMSGLDTLASADKLLDCALAARAKLAQEREAALPEEAKRWREYLNRIRNYINNEGEWRDTVLRLCNEALEQGA